MKVFRNNLKIQCHPLCNWLKQQIGLKCDRLQIGLFLSLYSTQPPTQFNPWARASSRQQPERALITTNKNPASQVCVLLKAVRVAVQQAPALREDLMPQDNHQGKQTTSTEANNETNKKKIQIKFAPISKIAPPHICTHAHYEHAENQSACPIHGPHSVTLAKGNRQGHANVTFLFLFSSSVSRHRVLSCCPQKTRSPPFSKGGLRWLIRINCYKKIELSWINSTKFSQNRVEPAQPAFLLKNLG